MNRHPRNASGKLGDDFAAKATVIVRVTPLHRRRWFQRLVFCLGCSAGLIAAVGFGFLSDWHDTQRADLERQRAEFGRFLQSEEFGRFVGVADQHLVAVINFIATRPMQARAAFPTVTDFETRHGAMPWNLEVLPLPVSAAVDAARVAQAHRSTQALLCRRGHRLERDARTAGRHLFLRLLIPHLRAFLQRHQDYDFSALALDTPMQEAALTAFATGHGTLIRLHDAERMFALYAAVGPAMWQAIEQERNDRARNAFAAIGT